MAKKQDPYILQKKAKSEKEKSYLYWITRMYMVFIFSVLLLYVGPEGYNNIIFRKAQVYWTVSIIFIIAFILFHLVYILGIGELSKSLKFWKYFKLPDWALLVYWVVMTISCILSKHQDIVWLGFANRNDGWLTYTCMILSYYILSRWYRPRNSDFILFSAGSIAFSIIGFLQFYGLDLFKLFPYYQYPYVDQQGNPLLSGFSIVYRSTLGNIDFVSAYVCMAIIAFAILYIKTEGKLRFLYAITSVMNFLIMIIGGADAGKMGVAGAMVLLIPYWIYKKQNIGKALVISAFWGLSYVSHHFIMIKLVMPGWNRENRPANDLSYRDAYHTLPLTPILILSLIVLFIGLGMLYWKPQSWPQPRKAQIIGVAMLAVMIVGALGGIETIGQKLPETNIIYQAREIMHGNLEDDFGSRRGFIWKRAVARVPYIPMLGTGTDTFVYGFGDANQQEARQIHNVGYDKAHNDFIQILICHGFIGLLSYLVFIISLFAMSIKKAFDDRWLLILIGTSTAYLIQSFFGIDTIVVTPMFWAYLALVRQRQNELVTQDQG